MKWQTRIHVRHIYLHGWFLWQVNISVPWILQESHLQTAKFFQKIQENSILNIQPNQRLIGVIPSASSLSCFHYTCFCLFAPTPRPKSRFEEKNTFARFHYEKKKVPYNGKEIPPYNWVIHPPLDYTVVVH